MLVHCSHGKCFLVDCGQVAEQVFGVFSFFVRIQLHLVDTCQGEHGKFVVFRKAGLDFELPVYEVGQEGQAQYLEQELQVRLAYGEEVGGAVVEVPAAAQGYFGCAEGCLEGLFVGVAVAQAEIEHRA